MWDDMPQGESSYNMRQLEAQCSNLNGISLRDWYCMDVRERNWKVVAMISPGMLQSLEVRRHI